MTSNPLDRAKIHIIFADGARREIENEKRLKALILKLAGTELGEELEDEHTCQLVLHLGRRGDVKADVLKKGY